MTDETLLFVPNQKLLDVLKLLSGANLEEVFLGFCGVTGAPPDLRCIMLVAANLNAYFKAETTLWRGTACFARWPELVEFIEHNANEIQHLMGDHVSPKPKATQPASNQRLRNPMYGEITQYPIFAMLCDQHAVPDLRQDYAALQLQFLYAHWLELEAAELQFSGLQQNTTSTVGESAAPERMTRRPKPYARAVRDLSAGPFDRLLKYLAPSCSPERFRIRLREPLPFLGKDFFSQFVRIREYCDKQHRARKGGTRTSGDRRPPRLANPESIFYNDRILGIKNVPPSEEDEAVIIHGSLNQCSLSIKDALALGLAPEELIGGELLVNADVPGAADRYEALAAARDKVRSFEFERRLFPWNSEALRLEEMHFDLLPAFKSTVHDTSPTEESLAGALINAILIETGRGIDDALLLEIVQDPRSTFGFQLPSNEAPYGYWTWPAIEPDYADEWDVSPEMEADRASFLRYRGSPIVTSLILQFCRHSQIRAGKLFRRDCDYKHLAQEWMTQHNPRNRYTFTRLANLRWMLLHEATDGDLVTACLTLGVRHRSASVQLHYGVAEFRETKILFEETSARLWKSDSLPIPVDPATDNLLIGCRAFPKLDRVRKVVDWLRAGSMALFTISPSEFDLVTHRDYLNRAVLYLIWHQFFSFGTRAIRDAYQDKNVFASSTGMGTLSDKDFADGYKTRVIWASETLRNHMKAVEQRLSAIAAGHNLVGESNGYPVWFLGDQNKITPITPTEIKKILGDRFGFPINTPRKVIRNLLRKRGMSYEYAEAYMGHWSHGREPWSPLSTFDYGKFILSLKRHVPACLDDLGFIWIPGESA